MINSDWSSALSIYHMAAEAITSTAGLKRDKPTSVIILDDDDDDDDGNDVKTIESQQQQQQQQTIPDLSGIFSYKRVLRGMMARTPEIYEKMKDYTAAGEAVCN